MWGNELFYDWIKYISNLTYTCVFMYVHVYPFVSPVFICVHVDPFVSTCIQLCPCVPICVALYTLGSMCTHFYPVIDDIYVCWLVYKYKRISRIPSLVAFLISNRYTNSRQFCIPVVPSGSWILMSTTRGIHNLASFWITQVPVVVVCTKMAEKRFAHLTEGEIEEKRSKIIPKSTLKANQKAARAFRQYLVEKEEADTHL